MHIRRSVATMVGNTLGVAGVHTGNGRAAGSTHQPARDGLGEPVDEPPLQRVFVLLARTAAEVIVRHTSAGPLVFAQSR